MKGFYLALFIVLFYIISDYLLKIKPGYTPDEYAYWAIALLGLNLLPSVHYILYRRKNVPFIPLVGIFYALSFALPVFYIDLNDYQLGILDIRALEFGFWGLLLFYIFYYISYALLKEIKPFNPVDDDFLGSKRILKLIMYSFMVVGFAGKFFSIRVLIQFYEPSLYIFAGLFLYLSLNKKLSFFESFFLIFLILIEFASRLSVGLLASSARYVLFLTIIYYLIKRKLPLIALGSFVLLYSFMLPVKMEYRKIIKESKGAYTTKEKLNIYYNLANEHYLEKSKKEQVFKEDEEEHFLWRFSYSASALSRVIVYTPSIIPYWDGYTFSTLYSKFIPRFIWPGKPKEGIGQAFGHRYLILHDSDLHTSMNLPWMAELYANWGRNAVFWGMAIFGILFGFLDRFFNSSSNIVAVIISAAIYFPLITQESNFAMQAGNMFLLTVSIYFFIKIIGKNLGNG